MASDFEEECSFFKELESFPRGVGVLLVHVKEGVNILPASTQPYTNYLLRVQVGPVTKGFKAVSHNHGNPKWNERVHVPVTVYRNATNPMNYIIFSLFAQGNFPGEESQVIGTVNVHLHDVVGARGMVKCSFLLKSFEEVVGEIRVKLQFFYGMFGYGRSMQLADEVLYAQAQVQQSLFPVVNSAPPKETEEKKRDVDKYGPWFKNVDYVIDSINSETSYVKRLAMLRQIVAGDVPTSEIPINLEAVEMSKLSKAEKTNELIPVAAWSLMGNRPGPK